MSGWKRTGLTLALSVVLVAVAPALSHALGTAFTYSRTTAAERGAGEREPEGRFAALEGLVAAGARGEGTIMTALGGNR